jgi:DNA-binding MarR family transcriptional regulator
MLTNVFLKEKPARALAALAKKDREWYASMLSKEINCTYPHLINTLAAFEAAGLVKMEEQGRINVIRLTEAGEDLAHDLEGLLRRLERIDSKAVEKTEKVEEVQEPIVEEKTKKK